MVWYESESSKRPDAVDTKSSKTVVFLRRNIKEVTRTDEEETTVFEYEESKLTKEEYAEYLKALDLINFQQVQADLYYVAIMAGVEL